LRADNSDRVQKLIQMTMIWLLPILGAVIVLPYTRNAEKESFHRFNIDDPVGGDGGHNYGNITDGSDWFWLSTKGQPQ